MKTQVLLFALFCSVFAIQVQGQSRTYINATNSEISDNLDLRVVASIFGDSKNLNDFESQVNSIASASQLASLENQILNL